MDAQRQITSELPISIRDYKISLSGSSSIITILDSESSQFDVTSVKINAWTEPQPGNSFVQKNNQMRYIGERSTANIDWKCHVTRLSISPTITKEYETRYPLRDQLDIMANRDVIRSRGDVVHSSIAEQLEWDRIVDQIKKSNRKEPTCLCKSCATNFAVESNTVRRNNVPQTAAPLTFFTRTPPPEECTSRRHTNNGTSSTRLGNAVRDAPTRARGKIRKIINRSIGKPCIPRTRSDMPPSTYQSPPSRLYAQSDMITNKSWPGNEKLHRDQHMNFPDHDPYPRTLEHRNLKLHRNQTTKIYGQENTKPNHELLNTTAPENKMLSGDLDSSDSEEDNETSDDDTKAQHRGTNSDLPFVRKIQVSKLTDIIYRRALKSISQDEKKRKLFSRILSEETKERKTDTRSSTGVHNQDLEAASSSREYGSSSQEDITAVSGSGDDSSNDSLGFCSQAMAEASLSGVESGSYSPDMSASVASGHGTLTSLSGVESGSYITDLTDISASVASGHRTLTSLSGVKSGSYTPDISASVASEHRTLTSLSGVKSGSYTPDSTKMSASVASGRHTLTSLSGVESGSYSPDMSASVASGHRTLTSQDTEDTLTSCTSGGSETRSEAMEAASAFWKLHTPNVKAKEEMTLKEKLASLTMSLPTKSGGSIGSIGSLALRMAPKTSVRRRSKLPRMGDTEGVSTGSVKVLLAPPEKRGKRM